jgi:hypothetical protein
MSYASSGADVRVNTSRMLSAEKGTSIESEEGSGERVRVHYDMVEVDAHDASVYWYTMRGRR